MMWIFLATGAELVNAVVAIFDKYIVSDQKTALRPFVYAYYTCLFTSLWVVVYAFAYIPGLTDLGFPSFYEVHTPSLTVIALAFLAAYTFFIALVSMYDALRRSDASNTMPVIGSISALSSFGLSYLFLGTHLPDHFVTGIVLLAAGTALVAQTLPKITVLVQVFHSGLFFALHYITMKGLFSETNFADGFFWSRVCFALFALSLLLVPAYFEKVRTESARVSRHTGFVVLLAKLLAGVASFMLLKATDLGEVSVVQALDGLRYVFILLIGVVFATWLPPSVIDRDCRPHVTFRRALYVIILLIGFLVLFT